MEKICKQCKKTSDKWATKDTCLECFNKPKPKYYYDVKVEAMLPSTLTYRVLAEDPDHAAQLIKKMSPVSVQHRLIGRKESKLTVYDAGCSIIRLVINLFGK